MSTEKPSSRKLAAILFADIVGYTALMQRGESKAMSILNRFKEVTIDKVAKHSGEVIKTYGDGSLILFDSTVDAVQCAHDMQVAFRDGVQVPLRIGIHVGEVIKKDQDIFGNGVNIAARVESMGVAGAVLMSADAHKRIKNQEHLTTQSLGHYEFKNVEETIEVFALSNEGFTVPKKEEMKGKFKEKTQVKEKSALSTWWPLVAALFLAYPAYYFFSQNDSQGATVIDEKSIAVLPFTNMSNDEDGEIFCDGMMEDILTNLTKLDNLKVISRTSSIQYKGTSKKIPQIANELGVAHILEGSVRKYGNKARITVQLIHAKDDKHIWAENYDRDLSDIFQIQSEVSAHIAETLKMNLSPQENSAIHSDYKIDPEAYKYYVQGKRAFETRTKEGLESSIELINKSIEIDPNFADAYANIAIAIYNQDVRGYIPREGVRFKIDSLADIALNINANSINGRLVKSITEGYYRGNFSEAAKLVKEILQVAPNDAAIYHAAGGAYSHLGKYDEALTYKVKARDLNPLFWLYQYNVVDELIKLKKWDQAEEELKSAKQLFPEYINRFLIFESRMALFKGEYQKCIDIIQKRDNINIWDYVRLGSAYAHLGNTEKAKEYIDLIKVADQGTNDHAKSIVYISLNNMDRAFSHLNNLLDIRRREFEANQIAAHLMYIKITVMYGTYYEPIRGLPQYKAFIERLSDIEPFE